MDINSYQQEILKMRYALSTEDNWSQVALRNASHVAKAEIEEQQDEFKDLFFDIINNGDFCPAGRILYGSGRKIGALLNCFCLGIDDNRHSIAKFLHDVYLVATSGGGIGTNYSKIRPRGESIQGVMGVAPGVISEIKKIDSIGEQVMAGGGRRCALLACLRVDHPDILEFLSAKLDLSIITHHNISILLNNEFLKMVEDNKMMVFTFKNREYIPYLVKTNYSEHLIMSKTREDTDEIFVNQYKKYVDEHIEVVTRKRIYAKDIWNKIVENALKCGEPGIQNIDNIKDNFATSYFEEFSSTNPCGEAILSTNSICDLGSVNLSNMHDEEKNEVNWKKLAETIRLGVRFLDDVITMNIYPIPETKFCAEQSRRIGLGTMGLHYLLIKLGYEYGSNKCIEFVERLYTTIRNEAFDASCDLAEEKGTFIRFDSDRYIENKFIQTLPARILRKIKKHGIRNAVLLTQPPNGTISMVCGVSSSIEPIFSPIYLRRYMVNSTKKEELVMDKLFAQYLKGDKSLKSFKGAHEITPEEHLAIQAAVQKYTDQAVSKTVNLPANYTGEELSDLLLEYLPHLKGVTIYRQGSRGEEPLQFIDINKIDKEEALRTAEIYTQEIGCVGGSCEL